MEQSLDRLKGFSDAFIATWTVTVTSNYSDYVSYCSWKKNVEADIWTSSMSTTEKLDALKNYIKTNFTYGNYSSKLSCYTVMIADCFGASDMFGDMAKDLGLEVRYCSTYTGEAYVYISEAVSAGGHMFCKVYINGSWVQYDACP